MRLACPVPDPVYCFSRRQGKYLLGDERDGEQPYDTLGELILIHAEYVAVARGCARGPVVL